MRVREAKALIQQWLLPNQPKRIAMYCRYRNYDPRKMSCIRNLGKSPTLRGGNVNKTYCSLVWLVPQSHCTIQEKGKRTQKETWHPAISELEITLFQLREYHCSNTGGKWKHFGLWAFDKKPIKLCFFQTINSSRRRVLEISKDGLRSQEATEWMMNYLATVENLARSGGRMKSRGVTWQMWQRLWRPQSTSSSLRKNGELEGGNNDRATEWLESQF